MIKIFGKLKLKMSSIALQRKAIHSLNVTMNNLVALEKDKEMDIQIIIKILVSIKKPFQPGQ